VPGERDCSTANPLGLGVDWELLARFYKSAEKLGDRSRRSETVRLLPNIETGRPSRIRLGVLPDAVGVIIPHRN
jgi:hypothetical protein